MLTSNYDDLMAHKMEYLKTLKELPVNPANVVILGAGPGGLARALIAELKGAHYTLVEKRGDFLSRDNIIKIRNIELLQLLGITEKLIHDGRCHEKSDSVDVKIKDLQKALQQVLEAISGPINMKQGYTLSNVQVEPDLATHQFKTKCTLQKTDSLETLSLAADIVVDATGAGAALAELIDNRKTTITSEHAMYVAVVFDMDKEIPMDKKTPVANIDEIQPFHIDRLSTPGRDYLLIMPSPLDQKKLRTCDNQIISLTEAFNTSQDKAIKSVLTQQIAQIIAEKMTLTLGLAQSAGRKMEIPDDVIANNVETCNTFPIDISYREPGAIIGDCLIQQSGDSLATPDPYSGTGCNTALLGSYVFAKSLTNRNNPRMTIEESFQAFCYASKVQTDDLIMESLETRKFILKILSKEDETSVQATAADIERYRQTRELLTYFS